MKPGKKKPGPRSVMVRALDHVEAFSGDERKGMEERDGGGDFSMKAMRPVESTPMAAEGQISRVVREVECAKGPR
jgi:hypothetical protein